MFKFDQTIIYFVSASQSKQFKSRLLQCAYANNTRKLADLCTAYANHYNREL